MSEEEDIEAAATHRLDAILAQAAIAAEELQEAETHDLPLLRARSRKKSKELEEQAKVAMDDDAVLRRAFGAMDASGDGQLDHSELKHVFELAGRPASDEAIDRAFRLLDQDKDGLVSFEES